ncbi:oocyte zinc finger protein XlCOF7.1-like [Bombina bombina]|uniref:oocyte zinc finger protein XlCOF7.1-like n=1 Tax=Bombina bombina TaxID=8345 RepID=UPI00235AEE0B|nr:oocyte zinc finger protein XlCOF7.1-like [Bombina bombina]XP_053567647.1 oocyte zinc finger protein XlCOF7.1-like [Bombina bombina]
MNKCRKQMAEQFLSQALSIICLLTGEEYAIVKKRPSHKIILRQSREVPIKCEDVAVYFSMEEWEYIEGHKELYKHVMMETHQALTTMEIPGNESSELIGPSDENLDTGAAELVQNIQPVETPSAVSAELTGHCNENLDTESHGELVQNVQPSDVSADDINNDVDVKIEDLSVMCQLEAPMQEMCYSNNEELTGHCNENLDTESHGELVQNVQPSDVSADDINNDVDVKIEDLSVMCQLEAPMQEMCYSNNEGKNDAKISSNTEQTEYPWLTNITEAAQQEILVRSNTGDVKTEVTLNAEQANDLYVKSQLEAVKQEIGDNISTGELTNSNNPSHGQNADASFNLQNQISDIAQCSEYEKKCFTRKSQLCIHHKREKAFICSICGKRFNWKSNLTSHLKIHTGEKAFSCSRCGKYFIRKSHLSSHQKIHTGEKPFSCSECGKCFTQQSSLIEHKRIHTGEKPFSCSECEKCFTLKGQLIRHLKIHTGEKAFLCSACGKCFAQKFSLIRHQKVHIKEKTF